MITVHHLNNSRSQRVLWLLEELGVPYEIGSTSATARRCWRRPSSRAVHPLGKSPVITDGDVTIAESGAIVEYLVERYGDGRLAPAARHARAAALHLLAALRRRLGDAAAADEAHLRQGREGADAVLREADRARDRGEGAGDDGHAEPARATSTSWKRSSRSSKWFAGNEFTAADIQMSFPLEAASQRAGLDASRPKLMAFLERIHARPAYKHALERGGPYSFAED